MGNTSRNASEIAKALAERLSASKNIKGKTVPAEAPSVTYHPEDGYQPIYSGAEVRAERKAVSDDRYRNVEADIAERVRELEPSPEGNAGSIEDIINEVMRQYGFRR